MTASERSAADRALDVFVYLPAGAVVTALEEFPGATAKGRARIERQVRNAQFVGRLAVDFGWRQLKDHVEAIAGERLLSPTEEERPARSRDVHKVRTEAAKTPPPGAGRRTPGTSARRDLDVDAMISDYDVLSASQVVRRLGGLGVDELRTIVRHELATRARRTILQRADQLLEADRSGGPDPTGRQTPP